MREGLDAPTFELPPAKVEEIRSSLDGQSRVRIAAWVRHEHQTPDGPGWDHHLVLGVADEDWTTGDMRALEDGMELPALATSEPTWIDLFPVSEVEALRAFGTVLWEQTSVGGDPLDYRHTYEPFVPDPESLARFAGLLAAQPTIRSVQATVQKLWKGERLVEERVQLFVDAAWPPNDVLSLAHDAAAETILSGRSTHGATLGAPRDEAAAILYEAAA